MYLVCDTFDLYPILHGLSQYNGDSLFVYLYAGQGLWSFART